MADPTEISTFSSQRLTLSYARWGDKDAPPLLLVHGGRDQKLSWQDVASALSTDYCVYAHDLRGHGQSEWVNDGDYGVMDHVFDFASFVNHLELKTFTLIGHSLGGNIAIRYTGLYPDTVKKLVAIEGLGPSPKMVAERNALKVEERLRDWIEQRRGASRKPSRQMKDFAEARQRMANAHSYLTDDQIDHLTRTGIRESENGAIVWAYDPAFMARSPSDISYEDFQRLWAQIRCPSWLVYGADSWASDPSKDGRAEYFPTGTVTVIEKANHWVHHDQFDVFMSALQDFLHS